MLKNISRVSVLALSLSGVSAVSHAQILEYLPVLIYVAINATEENLDTDGDGVPDREDSDIDGDGIPNSADMDADGDGIRGDDDAFPNDPREWTDLDGDGVGDNADEDRDGDGILNAQDSSPDDIPTGVCP